jgi:hypothetical protein
VSRPRSPRARAGAAIAGLVFAGGSAALSSLDAHMRPDLPTPAASAAGRSGEAEDASASCGIERWAVKTGVDPDAARIDLSAVKSATITQLDALAPPVNPTARVAPTELTVFEVSATLTGYKTEADSDYHLVLTKGRRTMIAEIPLPDCVAAGPLASGIANARAEFDRELRSSSKFKRLNRPVTVRGVGFFDKIHGQTGVAPNGIELHPVLDIAFD